VPDWPTTYGYNMFLFPISKWMGGIFYEHTHRLVATVVGTLVVALTRWLGGRDACKPLIIIGLLEILAGFAMLQFWPQLKGAGYFLSGIGGVVLLAGIVWLRNEPATPAIQKLGWLAFALVQIQGLLGGLRVVLIDDRIGIFHAALAQMFFAVLCVIALCTSRWWQTLPSSRTPLLQRLSNPTRAVSGSPSPGGEGRGEGDLLQPALDQKNLRPLFLVTTFLIFAQLILGATMRHQHAGLAIPDFPLAYHKLWPPMDAVSVASYNQHRLGVTDPNPITATQILLQMIHRILALAITCAVLFCAWVSRRQLGARHPLAKLSLVWLGLILLQIVLGAATIWSDKAADIATAHVVDGALSLIAGALLTIISFRVLIPARVEVPVPLEPSPILPGKQATSARSN
jgi:cytochrome c oxidase assembly protein subunit 15